jgi:hypothetical protein
MSHRCRCPECIDDESDSDSNCPDDESDDFIFGCSDDEFYREEEEDFQEEEEWEGYSDDGCEGYSDDGWEGYSDDGYEESYEDAILEMFKLFFERVERTKPQMTCFWYYRDNHCTDCESYSGPEENRYPN